MLLAEIIAKIKHTRCAAWRRNLSHNSLFRQIFSVSLEELPLLHLFRCELSRFFTATITAFFCPLTYAG